MIRPRMEIVLRDPVEVDGVRHETLQMRRAKRRDFGRSHRAADYDHGIAFIALLCGVPPRVILALGQADLDRAVGLAAAFEAEIA